MPREPPQGAMKVLISYGGSFKEQRQSTMAEGEKGKLRYVGGETRIISLDRCGLNMPKLLARISEILPGALLSLHADPPGHWLFHRLIWGTDLGRDDGRRHALRPILGDEDVRSMVAEYDRFLMWGKVPRLRVFLCDTVPSLPLRFPELDASPVGEGDFPSGRTASSSRSSFLESTASKNWGSVAGDPPSTDGESPPSGFPGCSRGNRQFGLSGDLNVLQERTMTSGIPDRGGSLKNKATHKDSSDGDRLVNPPPAAGGGHFLGQSENLNPSLMSGMKTREKALPSIAGRRAAGTFSPPPPSPARRSARSPPPSSLPVRSRIGGITTEAVAGRLPGDPSDALGMIKPAKVPISTDARKPAAPGRPLDLASSEGTPEERPWRLRAGGGSSTPSPTLCDTVPKPEQRPGQALFLNSGYWFSHALRVPPPCITTAAPGPPVSAIRHGFGPLESSSYMKMDGASLGAVPRMSKPSCPGAATFNEQGARRNKDASVSSASEAAAAALKTIKGADLEEIRELGSGTFGTVFHGKWRGSDVAVKRLKPSCFSGGGAARDRLIADFWKEAHLLAQLHHPNVVAFYGVVTDGTSLATVTEYMVNGSLKQVLRKKDRTIDRRKRLIIAMDAAFGMEYLHEKGVVHFDLKSHNFLVNMRDPHRPVCKIGDLGLSKVKRRTLVSGGVRGTIPWMAPELLNSQSNMVTDKVDVYSFGVVMWELLTGEEPYGEMPSEQVIGGIIKGELRPEIPSWCEPMWRSLMERCWASDPSSRPAFSDIAKELRAMAAAMNIL
ncbi:unnamed protein product [Spirodela intermedia]|uniref:Protein kinase domain-containing protein n=1 Tax=Spirodela intermedia TaxID=51605 RepID=A0A7I8L068_SPIIN|nr:unnamed protein product [Spirodela intermedia]